MTTEKTRWKYTPDFKKDAVALVTEQGYSIAKAAQADDTKENHLRRWKKELEQEANGARLTADERAELARLRREYEELLMEKEILKKAGVFFAKEMKCSKASSGHKRVTAPFAFCVGSCNSAPAPIKIGLAVVVMSLTAHTGSSAIG